jgi:uncharacterized membrane protein YbaN (DUF454 family)
MTVPLLVIGAFIFVRHAWRMTRRAVRRWRVRQMLRRFDREHSATRTATYQKERE